MKLGWWGEDVERVEGYKKNMTHPQCSKKYVTGKRWGRVYEIGVVGGGCWES